MEAVDEDGSRARRDWLAALPKTVEQIASGWSLELEDPFLPGGQCAWVAPARDRGGDELVLKVGWRHPEAEHEADALRFWGGGGAVRCRASHALEDTTALLLERCVPGVQLNCAAPELEQDVVLAGLLRRLWERRPLDGHPFGSLEEVCEQWANGFEHELPLALRALDLGLARAGIALLRELPRTATETVLLCTDLHAGNVLASRREPWLVIDPKPLIGDPAFDAVQHMLNCGERLATDPARMAERMAGLLEVDAERVRLWLFARCAQESPRDLTMREPARRLAP